VTVLIDTSALFALLDADDARHEDAVRLWALALDVDLVAHAYIVVESVALVRSRLGWAGVRALVDDVLPGIRTESVDRSLHEQALADYRSLAGSTSFVDRVSLAFARASSITTCFAFDPDLEAAGLAAYR
jgi:predicted nucleic acid-binding protein